MPDPVFIQVGPSSRIAFQGSTADALRARLGSDAKILAFIRSRLETEARAQMMDDAARAAVIPAGDVTKGTSASAPEPEPLPLDVERAIARAERDGRPIGWAKTIQVDGVDWIAVRDEWGFSASRA